jgi:hypothetical protein
MDVAILGAFAAEPFVAANDGLDSFQRIARCCDFIVEIEIHERPLRAQSRTRRPHY